MFAIVLVLHLQVERMEEEVGSPSFTGVSKMVASRVIEADGPELQGHLLAALESDAQYLRSTRAQSGLSARLIVQVVAELVGLSLVVLGGTLIFARIRAEAGSNSAELERDGWKVGLRTTYPGVFLSLAGAVVCIWTLNLTVHDNARIIVQEVPQYVRGAVPAALKPPGAYSKAECEAINLPLPECEKFK